MPVPINYIENGVLYSRLSCNAITSLLKSCASCCAFTVSLCMGHIKQAVQTTLYLKKTFPFMAFAHVNNAQRKVEKKLFFA